LSGEIYVDSGKILDVIKPLADSLIDLMIEGNWVTDQLILNLPKMNRLESVRILPTKSRINTLENRLSTSAVVNFASKCQTLMEPRYLRDSKILTKQDLWRGDIYHPDWRVYCQIGGKPVTPTFFDR
jgi:hypothetical protein